MAALVYHIASHGDALDKQGGAQVVYQATVERPGQGPVAPTADEMERTRIVVEQRAAALGVIGAQVELRGSDQIAVTLPGVKDLDRAVETIAQTAMVKFYDDGVTRISGPEPSFDRALAQARRNPQLALASGALKDLARLAKGLPQEDLVVVTAAPGKLGENTEQMYFIYRDRPAMTGDTVQTARRGFEPGGSSTRPDVEIDFTDEGGKTFQEVTKRLWDRGAFAGAVQTFAIVLDGKMESDPQIDYTDPSLSGGIAGDKAIITGNFTIKEAEDLALGLDSGALPVTLTVVQASASPEPKEQEPR